MQRLVLKDLMIGSKNVKGVINDIVVQLSHDYTKLVI